MISHTFTQIRNKDPVPCSRFPVLDYQFYIYICSFYINLTQKNNVNSLESFNAIPADEINKTRKTSINTIKVKQEPGTGSLFPICTFEILVLYTEIRNKE